MLALDVNYFIDPQGDTVLAAGADGSLIGVKLSTNKVSKSPAGPEAPLTSLTCYAVPDPSTSTTSLRVYAGSWDKSVWAYKFEESDAGYVVTGANSFSAHADFVKCVAVVVTPDRKPVLATGGADGDVRLWSLDGASQGKINPGYRGIECIILDPFSSPESPTMFFSTSQREIVAMRIPESTKMRTIELSPAILAHETSVYNLHFDSQGDLWTASADKTAKRLVREDDWKVDTVLQHPDFVRDVITHDKYGLVITACRDEEIRVWDRATSKLRHIFSGHYEEVTSLALSGNLLISSGIDATLRKWSLAPADLQKAIDEAKNPVLADSEPAPEMSMLTAEEEAELQAMMAGEEADTLEKMAAGDQ